MGPFLHGSNSCIQIHVLEIKFKKLFNSNYFLLENAICILSHFIFVSNRIRCTAVPKCIDPVIPDFDLEDFQKPWVKESTVAKDFQSGQASPASSEHIAKTKDNLGEGGLTPDSTSLDSGIGVINSESSAPSESSSPVKDEEKTSDKPMEENQEELEKSGECEDVSKEKPEADKCNNQDVDKNVSDEAESTVEKVSGKAISQVHSLGTTREENESHLSCGDNQLHLTTLDELDNHTGVLHVWFLVFEGLATTASAAPKNFQPQTLETLFNLLRSAAQVPGELTVMNVIPSFNLVVPNRWFDTEDKMKLNCVQDQSNIDNH